MRGIERNATWDDQASKVALPRSEIGITKEYQTMNDSVAVKQADVVLLPYPLEFQQNLALTGSLNYTTTNSIQDLEYVSQLFILEVSEDLLTKESIHTSKVPMDLE